MTWHKVIERPNIARNPRPADMPPPDMSHMIPHVVIRGTTAWISWGGMDIPLDGTVFYPVVSEEEPILDQEERC
jgi:hypothetical protein